MVYRLTASAGKGDENQGEGGGGTSYDGLYVEVPLQVNGMVGILLVEVYRRLRKSVIWVCERAQKGYQMNFIGLLSREKVLFLWLTPI